MAVGTNQGVAGLAPRPFTLGEETGSHHAFMFIAPARDLRTHATTALLQNLHKTKENITDGRARAQLSMPNELAAVALVISALALGARSRVGSSVHLPSQVQRL